tara:strand:+ start:236 stop:1078 length:843 start_codon:yes stop_codon:yes gene_type:complete
VASYPRVKTTEQIRSLFQKVATTNHYEVFFNGFASLQSLRGYITTRAPLVNNFFISRDLGLLCNSAELPGTSMATAQIEGNRMGIVEKFAHTRVYTDTTLTFYVDSDYRVVQFFELWHDFIASGSGVGKDQKAYYNRMRYPDEYKISTMRIQKFNKDHFRNVEYTFLNAFPVNVSSMPVSYDGANVLELQVTFAYDRYFFGKLSSLKNTGKDLQDNGGAVEIRTPEAVGNGQFKDNMWAKGPLQNAYSDGKLTEEQFEYLTHEKPKGVYGPTDIINNDMA